MAGPPTFPSGAIGPADLTFGAVALGRSSEVTLDGSWTTADAKSAQAGEVPDGIYTAGLGLSATCLLAETTIVTILALTPNSLATDDGAFLGNSVGENLRLSADTLLVKPYVNGAPLSDESKWIRYALASPIPDFSLPYNVDGERYFNVLFRAYEVREEDIAAGGILYASGNPIWPVGKMALLGSPTITP
jgi:hypothetical protein